MPPLLRGRKNAAGPETTCVQNDVRCELPCTQILADVDSGQTCKLTLSSAEAAETMTPTESREMPEVSSKQAGMSAELLTK